MKSGLKAATVLYAGIFLLLIPLCKGPTQITPDATGTLTATYQLNASQDSFVDVDGARAVWLEDNAGKYVATIRITLGEGSIGLPYTTRLPHWKADACPGGTPPSNIDALAKATEVVGPPTGVSTCTTSVATLGIKPGIYDCCVEVLVTGNYNIMLKAPIKIGGGEDQATGTIPIYTPSKHPTAGDILSNLQVKYTP